MDVLGYSRRGVLNSLFHEITFCDDPNELISEFLDNIHFPFRTLKSDIVGCEVITDQPFSDYGKSDTLLMMDGETKNNSIFFEARVEDKQRSRWRISKEFKKFQMGRERNKVDSSSLFVQLYHKVKLVKRLKKMDITDMGEEVDFSALSNKFQRKIGTDETVLRAVRKLMDHCEDTMYVSLVPDPANELEDFYHKLLRDYSPDDFPGWEIEDWGFIAWEDVKNFCESNDLDNTLKNFEFNRGQIYRE